MIERDIAEAAAMYAKLAAHLTPERRGSGGRRTPPSSRPPLRVEIVSHMHDLERYLAWWIGQARELLGDDHR